MNKDQSKSANRIQNRAHQLGFEMTKDQALELLAAANGFRNRHAWQAHLRTSERPALVQEHPHESNNDYLLVEGKGCWISMAGFSVHPYLTDEGVVVDVYAKGAEDESLASTWAEHREAELQLLEWHGLDVQKAEEWAEKKSKKDFSSLPAEQRFNLLEQYVHQAKGLLDKSSPE